MQLMLDRRRWLHLGLTGLLAPRALSLSKESTNATINRAKSVILVHTSGGMSQFESWDPKPDAPEEVRGLFKPMATSVPGIRFSEHMPKVAQIAKHLTVLRSMTHDDLDHGSATYVALTGEFHKRKSSNPPITPADHPTYGAVLKRIRPNKNGPYTAIHLNGPVQAPFIPAPGQNGGFLGKGCEPFVLGNVLDEEETIRDLSPLDELPALRLNSRAALLQQLDSAKATFDQFNSLGDQKELHRQAFDLLAKPLTAQAFDLNRESLRTRERYGMNRAGQACLMARRLVEAGVPWVTVFFNHGIRGQDTQPTVTDEYGWDTHNDIFDAMRDHLMPRFDLGFSALIEDLAARGLLETTLVICMGEFGRAPRVALEPRFEGSSPGRKHWAACYSIALAGGGIKPGTVYGASDKLGAYPSLNPVTPGDLVATIFSALGIDPAGHFYDQSNRPVPITQGKAINALFS